MAVYPQIIIEVCTTDWIDISADVIGDIEGSYGILSSDKLARLADVGELKFTLRNDASNIGGVEGYYSPNNVHCLAGWQKGINARLKIYYEPDTITKWYGHIDSILIDPWLRQVEVSCLDYFDYFTNFPLKLVNVASNQKLADVVDLILTGMSKQPLNKVHNESEETFTSAFDTIKDNTKAISELNKLALSEFGFIYLRHGVSPETLVTEGRRTRNFQSNLTKIAQNGNYLTTESGDRIVTEDGEPIMLNSVQDTTFDSSMLSSEISYGENIANKIIVKSYPRKVDTSAQILFSLNDDPSASIPLAAGASKTIIGNYKDPNQLAQTVAGKNMISPVSGTDYAMYVNADGTGTDLTANLSVSGSYSATSVTYELTNTGATDGYVTKLQARGYGIYVYQSSNYETKDDTSISQNGIKELQLDQKYQSSPFVAENLANTILRQLKNPNVQLEKVSFLANVDDLTMMSFLYLEPGSLVYIKDVKSGIDSYFYLNGIEFKILQAGIIYFDWILTDALSLSEVYWILGTSKLGIDTILGY